MTRLPALCALLGAALAVAAPAVANEIVTFPSADGTTIRAAFMKPAGPGPFPAIVALHGCGGPGNARGELARRHADWGARWVSQGYAVVFPDSFGSRGLGSQCTTRNREVTPSRERTADVAGARAFLLSRPDIAHDRMNLVGWSNGASVVLWAMRPRNRPTDGRPDFQRAVAFYPGCRTPSEQGATTRVPLLVLIGDADNWTPAAPCRDYVAANAGRARIVTYPGAFHGFDDPNSPTRERTGLAFTGDGSGRAMVGTDPAARADSIRQVAGFLVR